MRRIRSKFGAAAMLAGLVFSVSAVAIAPTGAAASDSSNANAEPLCESAAPGVAQCLALRRTDLVALPASAMSPLVLPAGLGPADLKSAYALPGGSAGSGMTVAVVDAYDLPTAEADLAVYRAQYGLPPCTIANGCFRKVDQYGGTSYPTADTSWGGEIALDIDMVSATCPNCHILLVEAYSATGADLAVGVDTAVALGAAAVSNSYGVHEYYGVAYDSHYNHPGVAITAATGDCGYSCALAGGTKYVGVSFPASSPYVVAVGGTTLTRDGSARGWTESAWGAGAWGAGSGCSAYEPKPPWQHDVSCSNRMQADISAVAGTWMAVYDSAVGGWVQYDGTSAASPIIASVYALAGTPAAGTYPASYLYSDTADLNDVTSGNNDVWGLCSVTYFCNGVAGYDGPTGLGTPNGIRAFRAVHFTVPGKPTAVVATGGNTSASVSWTAPADNGGSAITGYTVTSSSDGKTCATSGTSCPVLGLTNGTPYTFTVVATNGVGPGPASDPSNSVTPLTPTVPGAPTNVSAIGSDSAATVSWTAPASNGSPIIGYSATASPGGRSCTTGGALTCTITGLTNRTTYSITITATNGVGTGPASSPAVSVTPFAGASYVALTPARILDTRNGTGLSGPSGSHAARTFQVTGHGGVPPAATAVTGNLTVTGQSSNGYLFLGPNPTDNPTSSTLNFPLGDDRANGVTVALSAGGTLSVTFVAPNPGPTAHMIFDVTGYFVPGASGATYLALTPARILDTRNGTGLVGPSGSHVARSFQVTGNGNVPANATAVTGNLTVTGQTSLGYLFLSPNPTDNPTSSTLNFPVGDDRANGVTVALGEPPWV
jgi:hypothetical protein